MAGSTYVQASAPSLTDEQSRATLDLVQAAFTAGYAAADERQSHMTEPMSTAVPLVAGPDNQQPFVPPEPGDSGGGGVT
jgi:hypothetical protein